MAWQLKRAEEEYAEEVGRMEEAMEELTARVRHQDDTAAVGG